VAAVTGTEVIQAVKDYTGITLDNATALRVINEALTKVSDRGMVYGFIEIAATAMTWYEMPNDATFLWSVEDSDGYLYVNYQAAGLRIRFKDSDTYGLTSRRQPIAMENLASPLGLHPIFEDCVVTYCRAFAKLSENDESMDGLRLMQEFKQDVILGFNTMRRNTSPSRWTVSRRG
jgi:hypothetical protein